VRGQAVSACRSPLTVRTREHDPQAPAEYSGGLEACRQAVADFEEAVAVFDEASHSQYSRPSKEQLAKARALAADLGHDTPLLSAGTSSLDSSAPPVSR
jgi:hypothetical protein